MIFVSFFLAVQTKKGGQYQVLSMKQGPEKF